MTEDVNSYDEVPYLSVALVETHPERLASIGVLFGMEPPPVESCRILELGCASGGNLLPLGAILPNAEIVGIDLSPRQIEQAQKTAEAAGLTNVSFHAMGITDITPEFGRFDYIICHGVYSWVPDDVKTAILRVISENLTPNGLAFLSYNTFPGWHFPGMIREMMLYHVRDIADPAAKVKAGRAILDFLATNVPDRQGPYAKLLTDEAAQLKPYADSYILHEHLEALNHPVYYHEFVGRVAASGLKVLGDSRVWAMASATQPAMSAVLDRLSHDPVGREQYYDFLTNRRFRRSILCHADRNLSDPTVVQVKKLRASASVWPTTSPIDHASKVSIDFRAADGMIRLSTTDPLFKTALLTLSEVYPRSMSFEELWTLTKSRLSRSGVEAGPHPDALATRLLQAYNANSVEFHSHEPSFPASLSETPEALPMARITAETNTSVPNLRHRQVALSEFDRLVIRQLDGKRTRAEIVEHLVKAVAEGQFTVNQNGIPLRDPATIRPIMEKSLPPSLNRLNVGGLLVR
jgi:methyltransferase-like protein/2-polyprenyl-3-methyl-5-hydroxy-6-metoxy-1,4-benzoquinol methylase